MFDGVGRRQDATKGLLVNIGQHSLNGYERNCLFRNNGDGTFTDVAYVNDADRVEDGRVRAQPPRSFLTAALCVSYTLAPLESDIAPGWSPCRAAGARLAAQVRTLSDALGFDEDDSSPGKEAMACL